MRGVADDLALMPWLTEHVWPIERAVMTPEFIAALVQEMRAKARAAGVLTPHILGDGDHLNQRETAVVLIKSGLSPLGPLACNTMAPDEGNMYLLGKVGSTGRATGPHLRPPLAQKGAALFGAHLLQLFAHIGWQRCHESSACKRLEL